MIIDRFGATYATAFKLSQHNVVDDFSAERPPVTSRVGGMHGEFDYYGVGNYPIARLQVRKSISLARMPGTFAGTGVVNNTIGTPYIIGVGTQFITELAVGDVVNIGSDFLTVNQVVDNLYAVASNNSGFGHVSAAYSIVRPALTTANVETAIDQIKAATISVGESKLWGLRRDGTRHWAWAKCIGIKTSDQVGNVYHLPATIEFSCREGVWYAETQSGTSIVHTDLSYDLVNAGNLPAAFELTITSSTGTLTAVTVTNTTNGDTFTWTGSATVGQTIIVKTGSYTVTKAGAGAYSGLTYGANQVNWLRLNPGTNTVTISVTGSTAWSGSMAWWDTYL